MPRPAAASDCELLRDLLADGSSSPRRHEDQVVAELRLAPGRSTCRAAPCRPPAGTPARTRSVDRQPSSAALLRGAGVGRLRLRRGRRTTRRVCSCGVDRFGVASSWQRGCATTSLPDAHAVELRPCALRSRTSVGFRRRLRRSRRALLVLGDRLDEPSAGRQLAALRELLNVARAVAGRCRVRRRRCQVAALSNSASIDLLADQRA